MRYIKDFKENENIIGHYFCKQKLSGKSKNGKTYLSIKLVDKTGTIDGKIWEINSYIQDFEEGDFIKIDGETNLYQNEMQLKISRLRLSLEGEYDPKEYMPSTDKDVKQMHAELLKYIASVKDHHIRRLLECIIIENTDISSRLLEHSAAKNMHHGFLGGLLEHTLSVVGICDFLSGRYNCVNRDILVSAAMLHDIGKIFELSPLPLNDYTEAGQLLGHIVICSELISKTADKIPDFPNELKMILQHCILSHHGEYEWGSPKLPQVIEAVILHLADNIDAKTQAFSEAINEADPSKIWLGYSKIFQRNIRKSDYK